ncbi:MAG TPA: hypothetical protein VK348_10550 [Planctomycetota bacterium]|nr:hypothetical protein [Planctomycetota bacterium]
MDFLKRKRGASYAEIRDAASKKRLKLFPIVFGRAQALMGIVKSAPRGQGKAKMAALAAAGGIVIRRGPGRPPKSASFATAGLEGLDGIISAVKTAQHEKNRYRSALERIQSILGDALN